MLVTDKKYYMDEALLKKLDLMIKRMEGSNKDDNLIIIDGDEGVGKSNLEICVAYYVAHQTKRSLSMKNVFFDLDKLINFAVNSEKQIICWDEGALGGLSTEWWKKNQIKFTKLLMVARKKRHFFIICIPKFWKLNEYFVVDRSIALLHCYAQKNMKKGNFCYYNKASKEKLWNDWKKSKWRNYKKHFNLRGTFVLSIGKLIPEDEYEAEKDKAILSIDTGDKMSKDTEKLLKLQHKISTENGHSFRERSDFLNIPVSTLHKWTILPKKHEFLLENR